MTKLKHTFLETGRGLIGNDTCSRQSRHCVSLTVSLTCSELWRSPSDTTSLQIRSGCDFKNLQELLIHFSFFSALLFSLLPEQYYFESNASIRCPQTLINGSGGTGSWSGSLVLIVCTSLRRRSIGERLQSRVSRTVCNSQSIPRSSFPVHC